MSLQTQLNSFVLRVAEEFNTVKGRTGTLTALTTTDKSSLVAAINELKAAILTAVAIDDLTVATTSTYSSSKIVSVLDALKADILGGADPAYDTLLELQQALQNDQTGIAALTAAIDKRVRFDAAQTLTVPEQAQARDNIGVVAASDVGDVQHRLCGDLQRRPGVSDEPRRATVGARHPHRHRDQGPDPSRASGTGPGLGEFRLCGWRDPASRGLQRRLGDPLGNGPLPDRVRDAVSRCQVLLGRHRQEQHRDGNHPFRGGTRDNGRQNRGRPGDCLHLVLGIAGRYARNQFGGLSMSTPTYTEAQLQALRVTAWPAARSA